MYIQCKFENKANKKRKEKNDSAIFKMRTMQMRNRNNLIKKLNPIIVPAQIVGKLNLDPFYG